MARSNSAFRAKPGGTLGTAGQQLELGQPLHGPHLARCSLQQLRQRLLLEFRVTGLRGEPGAERQDFLGRDLGGREMLQSQPRPGNIARREGQVQSALPDRRVVRTQPQAIVEPALRLGELAGSNREVRPTKPDPIVVGRVRGRLFQRRPDLLDWHRDDRVEVRQLPEQAEPVGVAVPAFLDKLAQLVKPPLELEQVDQGLARLHGVLAVGPEGGRE